MYLGFLDADLTFNLYVKLVVCGTEIVSHCLILKPTSKVLLLSIVLYSWNFSASTGVMCGMRHATLLKEILPASACRKMASASDCLVNVRVCLKPCTTLS